MTSKNKLEYIRKYNKENYKLICVRFNKVEDADLYAYVMGLKNKQRYIRELIRADMNRK